MRDVLFYYPPFCMICELNKSKLKGECEKDPHIHRVQVIIKTSIFNLRFLNHFCMDFYVIKALLKDPYNDIYI